MRRYRLAVVVALLLLGASTLLLRARLGSAPPGPALPSFAAAQLRRVGVGRENRLALAEPSVRLPFAVPPAATLRLGFTLLGSRLKRLRDLEIDFIVSFESQGRREVLLRRRLDRDSGAVWHDVSLRLDALAGKRGELRLDTEVVKGELPLDDLVVWTPPMLAAGPVGKRPNFILLSIDTLRADHLGCYGHERNTSPNIDRLAREGVLFRSAIASSSWTLPSHASMLTGLYARRHEAVRFPAGTGISPAVQTLAELLWEAGYATAGFTDGGFLSAVYGFDRGFEVYAFGPPAASDVGDHLAENLARGSEWMASTGGRPFFLFLHTYAVHAPYTPRPPYDRMFDLDQSVQYRTAISEAEALSWLKSGGMEPHLLENIKTLYDAEIRQTDATFGRLIEELESSGLAEQTCVIVTSDHGEEFADHGRLFHRRADLYEELLRIPLIVWCPGRIAGGRVVEQPVSLIDIAPTILDLVGLPIAENIDGRSLSPSLRGTAAPEPRAILSEVDGSLENLQGAARALRTERYKLLTSSWRDAPKLFDLQADPGERRDLGPKRPHLVKKLMRELATADRPPPQPSAGAPEATAPAAPDAATLERLRALGYLEPEAERDGGGDGGTL